MAATSKSTYTERSKTSQFPTQLIINHQQLWKQILKKEIMFIILQ